METRLLPTPHICAQVWRHCQPLPGALLMWQRGEETQSPEETEPLPS